VSERLLGLLVFCIYFYVLLSLCNQTNFTLNHYFNTRCHVNVTSPPDFAHPTLKHFPDREFLPLYRVAHKIPGEAKHGRRKGGLENDGSSKPDSGAEKSVRTKRKAVIVERCQ